MPDLIYMAEAIRLARKGLYTTGTNPRVGCVLVRDNKVIGCGYHIRTGEGHAEVNALADARNNGEDVAGATAYVTLEPCSHTGRTPPCSQTLIDAGITRVVGAMTDPNPQVAGRGFGMLRNAGIDVTDSCMSHEAAQLNPGFIKRMSTGMPYVRIKTAASLDGRTAMQSGESKWITGPEARADVQKLRARSCAVLFGADSVLIDNPSMTVREVTDYPEEPVRQPLRVLIDGRNRVSPDAQIFSSAGDLLIAGTEDKTPSACNDQVSYWRSPETESGKTDLKALLRHLADQGINEVLVETGAELAGAFIQQQLADEIVLYTAPTLLGSNARPLFELPFDNMDQQIRWTWSDVRMTGNDLRMTLIPAQAV